MALSACTLETTGVKGWHLNYCHLPASVRKRPFSLFLHIPGVSLLLVPCIRHSLLVSCFYNIFGDQRVIMAGGATLPPPNPENRVTECIVLGIVLRVLAYATVVLRFLARRKAGSRYWWDDWLILAAAVRDRPTLHC
jgi:hypothetical protein